MQPKNAKSKGVCASPSSKMAQVGQVDSPTLDSKLCDASNSEGNTGSTTIAENVIKQEQSICDAPEASPTIGTRRTSNQARRAAAAAARPLWFKASLASEARDEDPIEHRRKRLKDKNRRAQSRFR